MENLGDQPVLEPLSFTGVKTDATNCPVSLLSKAVCLLCNKEFNLPADFVSFGKHLEEHHKLIINNIQEIADLPKYMEYWKKRIDGGLNLFEICKYEAKEQGCKDTPYYILSEDAEEDKQLRLKLHLEKVQERLDDQQKEREDDSFSRSCLFCTRHFHFNRAALFQHMASYHHFTICHPDNLVHTNELLSILEEKLHSLQCLYCEKTFKDAFVLKEHMRKKRHRRLRLSNYAYRQFFIVFPEKTAADLQSLSGDDDDDDDIVVSDYNSDELDAGSHDDNNDDDDDDNADTDDSLPNEQNENIEWTDWVGEPQPDAVCLFCAHTSKDTNIVHAHMKDAHQFDLSKLALDNNLTYYQQVKLINFIRRQVHNKACISCTERFDDREALEQHLYKSDHSSQLPDPKLWNQPQYFFPTYENDSLLCALLGSDDTELNDDGVEVIAEEVPVPANFLDSFAAYGDHN